MAKLQFSFACSTVDRMQALLDGSVQPEGTDFHAMGLELEEIYWRQLRHYEWDASEMSLSSYIMARSHGEDRLIGIPVYPSRMFRHSYIFVNTDKGITKPSDLRGMTVGVPEYQLTACLWIRGLLQHQFGVHPREITWRSGGEETPGREEKIAVRLPAEINCLPIPPDKTLSEMLDSGEIDALIAARIPLCFAQGSPRVRRLFTNYKEEEEAYYRETGIFPIMHIVTIKRSIYEHNRWIARSLYKACLKSKELALRKLDVNNTLPFALPWSLAELQRTKDIMGGDWWPYGIEKNKQTLEAALDYSYEQGLSERRMEIAELFAPELLDEFRV